ncbi:hypothetical protein SLS56_007336 [Neofusicoccum ribis]|uniref:N-acetyltransferase domain-containing protein n=1 Tax=Neofusicoccum ribis TaxID=45134 RepID=A0ABR3SN92_9PEZI
MPLEIRPLEEPDVPTFVSITTAALGSSGIGRILHDDPPHPAYLERRKERVRKTLDKPHIHNLKVVDTDNNDEMIACASWEIFENGRSDDELNELEQPFEPIEEERERFGQVQRDFFAYLNRVRRALGKTPHYFLGLLVTHPKHHRRGAGAMLIRWGTEQADRAGLISFLEATETGRPLYKRHGFEEQETFVIELSKYGGTGVEKNTTMIRQPVKN